MDRHQLNNAGTVWMEVRPTKGEYDPKVRLLFGDDPTDPEYSTLVSTESLGKAFRIAETYSTPPMPPGAD